MSGHHLDVAGPAGRSSVTMDGDVPVGSLLPRLALLAGEAVPGAAPFVALEDGTRLDAERSLVDQGVAPGTPVRLGWTVPAVDPSGEPPAPPHALPVDSAPPGAAVGRRRLILGMLGLVELRDAAGLGPAGRLRAARRWSDPRRRLGWLIGDPVLTRSVLIGVLGSEDAASPTPTARLLTSAFAAFREAVLGAGGREADVTRQRIAEQLTGTPRVMVVDCPVGDGGLAGHCDQLVDVGVDGTAGRPAPVAGGTVVSCPALVDHPVGEVPSALQLAATLAIDWHRLGITARCDPAEAAW